MSIRRAADVTLSVHDLVKRAEKIDLRTILIKLAVTLSVLILALIIMVVDLWLAWAGVIVTQQAKRLTAILAVAAIGLAIVAILAFTSLIISVVAYLRLSFLMERGEKEELLEEHSVLIKGVGSAIDHLPEHHREAFHNLLRSDDALRRHEALLDELLRHGR